jgi:hypothetical protein
MIKKQDSVSFLKKFLLNLSHHRGQRWAKLLLKVTAMKRSAMILFKIANANHRFIASLR